MMKAIILSAGYGKRLHPLTSKLPKPLLKIKKETLLSNTIKFLTKFGIKQVLINTHYLSDQIINYVKNNKFDLNIKVIKERGKILNTGGGVLNITKNFYDEYFLVINPDTIWNSDYLKELKLLENNFVKKNQKCSLLLVDKSKSFDKNIKGDFNLKNNLINSKNQKNLKYIYTGLQIIKPEVFFNMKSKIFSMTKIWDKLIKKKELYGLKSKINFLHVSNLETYKDLIKNRFKR